MDRSDKARFSASLQSKLAHRREHTLGVTVCMFDILNAAMRADQQLG